ncbi:hypothetical protein [Halospina denitrificans]|uniref:hypothetical protein n=1 Tax=Halospina denitrificans TaxID=332522 RepID=UPI001414F96F|nr:hypothetical protein [Halospina denitrificans]
MASTPNTFPDTPWLIIPGGSKPTARAIVADQLMALAPDYLSEDTGTLNAYRAMLSQ